MATLHLELDIDSDVHPELYVRLASIERVAARHEKLRQLAATGLIWEIARLHGPAFSDPQAVTRAPPGAPAFDLGGGRLPAIDAGSASDHPPLVPHDVPMLVDVVDQDEIARSGAAMAPLSLVQSTDAAGADASRGPSAHGSTVASALPGEAAGGRTRSARIKRMKDSGLFQNG